MIRRLLLITICLLTISIAEAKLKVTTEADGTVVLTLEASGDINGEFTYKNYASYEASSLLKPYLNATKMKIVTPARRRGRGSFHSLGSYFAPPVLR